MCIKSDFEEIILKLATYGQREKAVLLSSKFCPQYVVCPCPGLYICGKTRKKRVEIVLKLATSGQSDKGFLLTSTFVPKGLSAPALGLYICIKALKYIPGRGVRWAFTGPLVLWFKVIRNNEIQNGVQDGHQARSVPSVLCQWLPANPDFFFFFFLWITFG